MLLERTLDRCDIEGLPAWLETTDESYVVLWDAEVCRDETLHRTPAEPEDDPPEDVSVTVFAGFTSYANVYFSIMEDGGERRAYCEHEQENRIFDHGSSVLDPGVHDLGAILMIESGVYLNPLPEYGDLFDWSGEVTAKVEVRITVAQ